MTQQTQDPQAANNEFDAARIIVETLKQLDKQQQDRAIRFACDTLGLQNMPSHTGATVSGPSQSQPPPAGAIGNRGMDIKQFTESKAPKSDQQFAAVVAYYYRFEAPADQRKDEITAADLQEAARLANRRRPGSAVMTLNNAKNSGYLDAAGGGKFQINTVGENLVAMTLPGKIEETSSDRKGKKKMKSTKKKALTRTAGKSGK